MTPLPVVVFHEGAPYIKSIKGPYFYTLSRLGSGWHVTQRLIAHGPHAAYKAKHYDTLAQVAENCSGFGSLGQLMSLVYRFDLVPIYTRFYFQ